MSILAKVRLRGLIPDKDVNFILSTWLKSYRSSEFSRVIPTEVYYHNHQALVSAILTHINNRIIILCSADDPDQILGYVVFNTAEPILFYVYIKFSFRKLGLGTYLLETVKRFHKNAPVTCTHKLPKWTKVAKTHNLIYNPYVTGDASGKPEKHK